MGVCSQAEGAGERVWWGTCEWEVVLKAFGVLGQSGISCEVFGERVERWREL